MDPPREFFNIKDAHADRKPGECIIAKEYSTKHGGHLFLVTSYKKFEVTYRDMLPRRCHEILLTNTRTKFFLDLDSKELRDDAFYAAANLVVHNAKEVLLNVHGLQSANVLVLDCSRADKMSLHVVFPEVIFANTDELHHFVVKQMDSSDLVDKQVYSSNHGMRLPYSTGFSKNGQKPPIVPRVNKKPETEFNPLVLHYCGEICNE